MNKPIRLFYRGYQEHDHIEVETGNDPVGAAILTAFESKKCPNCSLSMTVYRHIRDVKYVMTNFKGERNVDAIRNYIMFICHSCGWHQLREETHYEETIANWAHQYHSLLEAIDISRNDVLISDLRRHLIKNWEDKKLISAKKAEDLVRDLLKEYLHGDILKVTTNVNSPDGGIDLFVCSSDGIIGAAIQVKRRITKNVEPVEQVRNFVGALVIEGYSKGIFVTTAEKFSKPAQRIASSSNLVKHKLELELIDGEKLLEMLKVKVPPEKIQLPMELDESTQWKDSSGATYSVQELLTFPK
jgi:restriction system protein